MENHLPPEDNRPQNELNSIHLSNHLNYEVNTNAPKTKPKSENKIILLKLVIMIFVVSTVAAPFIVITSSPTSNTHSIEFKFSDTSTTHEKINFTLIIENPPNDIKSEGFAVILTLPNETNQIFENSISSFKHNHQINLSFSTTQRTFTKYLSSVGEKYLKPNTTYCLNVVKDDKILKTQTVTTQDFTYIYGLDEKHIKEKSEKYIKFQPLVNKEFSDFKLLYIFTTDTTTQESTFSTIPKENLAESWYSQQVIPVSATKSYLVAIYCSTDNPDKLKYETENKIVDDEKVYLVYKHPELITI